MSRRCRYRKCVQYLQSSDWPRVVLHHHFIEVWTHWNESGFLSSEIEKKQTSCCDEGTFSLLQHLQSAHCFSAVVLHTVCASSHSTGVVVKSTLSSCEAITIQKRSVINTVKLQSQPQIGTKNRKLSLDGFLLRFLLFFSTVKLWKSERIFKDKKKAQHEEEKNSERFKKKSHWLHAFYVIFIFCLF